MKKPTRKELEELFSPEEFQRNRALFLRMAAWLMLGLSGLTLAWYTLILVRFGQFHHALANAVLGVLSFALIMKGKKLGVFLAMLWSAAQIVAVQVGSFVLDFVQVVSIHLPLANPLASGELVRINVNFLAILLFSVFVMNLESIEHIVAQQKRWAEKVLAADKAAHARRAKA